MNKNKTDEFSCIHCLLLPMFVSLLVNDLKQSVDLNKGYSDISNFFENNSLVTKFQQTDWNWSHAVLVLWHILEWTALQMVGLILLSTTGNWQRLPDLLTVLFPYKTITEWRRYNKSRMQCNKIFDVNKNDKRDSTLWNIFLNTFFKHPLNDHLLLTEFGKKVAKKIVCIMFKGLPLRNIFYILKH